jgi:GSCFA family
MQFALSLEIPALTKPIEYGNKILLIGSCFTEHISSRLAEHKFSILSNPNGILFNPLSVADSITGYLSHRQYVAADLFYLNELWNSWDHHTRFSHIDPQQALQNINSEQAAAATFVRQADYLIITLGSAFQYYLRDTMRAVANNHRAPSQWFEKKLLTIEDISVALAQMLEQLLLVNPGVHVVFTISPVCHIRDGVVDNNRSKARLIEVVHHLCQSFERAYYFPAYELVIDVLRDYRFYDVDYVHPNYLATTYVWEAFMEACISQPSKALMKQVQEIATARKHRPRFPETQAHRAFKSSIASKARALSAQYPFLDFNEEVAYFEE